MPELPEIETIAHKLSELLIGEVIKRVRVENHLLICGSTVEDFEKMLLGKEFQSFRGDGKFLVMKLDSDIEIVINRSLQAGQIWTPESCPSRNGTGTLLRGVSTQMSGDL